MSRFTVSIAPLALLALIGCETARSPGGGTPRQNTVDAGTPDTGPGGFDGAVGPDVGGGSDAGGACMMVTDQYNIIVANNSCSLPSDCQIVSGQCGVGLGGCYHAVNNDVVESDLVQLGQVYSTLGCTTAVCACAPPPTAAACVDSVCILPDP